MAKDKKIESAYKLERLRRTAARKAARREKRKHRTLQYGQRCPCCGQRQGNPEDDYWY